jgi:hypothetical protein
MRLGLAKSGLAEVVAVADAVAMAIAEAVAAVVAIGGVVVVAAGDDRDTSIKNDCMEFSSSPVRA